MPSLGNHDPLSSRLVSKEQIEQIRNAVESTVAVNGYQLQFDRASRDRMMLVIKGLKTGEKVDWKMRDNTVVTFTKAEFQKLYTAAEAEAGRQIIRAHSKAQEFKGKLERGERVTQRQIQVSAWTGD